MSNAPYNGYSWKVREKILIAFKRKKMVDGFQLERRPCDMCGDPECPPDLWHSEDYSEPYLFVPPATYVICNVCHLRIHKRFNEARARWLLYLIYLRSGGYGREFTRRYSLPQRREWIKKLEDHQQITLPTIRVRRLTGSEWWEQLTLDPDSLVAAWARPRPLRPRPPRQDYEVALSTIRPTDVELNLLHFHAGSHKRSITMRQLAWEVMRSESPSAANLVYGTLARRLWGALPTSWEPDHRNDGSPIWMSVIAEGWQPEGREFEWVMIPTLATMLERK